MLQQRRTQYWSDAPDDDLSLCSRPAGQVCRSPSSAPRHPGRSTIRPDVETRCSPIAHQAPTQQATRPRPARFECAQNVIFVDRQLGHASPEDHARRVGAPLRRPEHSPKASDTLEATLDNTEVTALGDGEIKSRLRPSRRSRGFGPTAVHPVAIADDIPRPLAQAGGHCSSSITAHFCACQQAESA